MATIVCDLQLDIFQAPSDWRQCSTCRVSKPTSEFHKATAEPSGYKRQCKSCVAKTFKAYYDRTQDVQIARATVYQKANPEKTAEWQRKTQAKGREKYNARKLERYYDNRDDVLAASRERYATDPEYRATMRQNAANGREKNPEYLVEYGQAYRDANPDAFRTHSANYRAKKANAEGSHTKEEWEAILDYFGHHCAYCLKHTSEVGTLAREHMLPLARGGTNYIENIVPSCKQCNSSKRHRTPLEFLARQSGFVAVGPVFTAT